jgi:hypothetical protein
MRPARAAWMLGLVVMAGAAGATYATCPGCIDRSRINSTCTWSGDTPFHLDSRNAAHRDHLVADAHLAEELAIRYADVEVGRRFGVEHHGGLLDGGHPRRECLSRMLQAIENDHGATSEQVQLARGGRNRSFDAAVALLFLPLYVLASIAASRRLARRFPPDERFARLVATGLVSVAVSFLGLQCLRLWGGVWETIRVGNGHMTSIRAASQTAWLHHVDNQLPGGVLLFWVVALCCYWMWPAEHPLSATRGPQDVIGVQHR